ncbi:uncharacterized protein HD556DRAFT_1384711 [Suillus plorans]|uniref:Uncharacterized protein n=1 Tax=Suillus plorans TaxID=116603 RepID=A0A9P7ALK8_9AGAM|nr:uncharacterized protein HD556DRAFT_1384711 [Suillus plorans]KAG1791755.1 hypothetical protein HD556DRAFT_1384711 [Suillus plorans]
MPLPDERPRQSVANLIGRFEQQNKRQSSSVAPTIPRSSSVSSQIAGDSAKEDTKEKREWPPKHVTSASADITALTLSSSSAAQNTSPPMSPQPTTEKPAETTTTASTPPEPARSPIVKKQVSGKATPIAGSRTNPTSPAKPRPSTASVKSPVKSPPKSSLSTSISQPIKPQHTGQSATSNTSTVRSTPKSVPKSTPVTPSRPKTPAVHTTNASRPKTPSSGLFAPTAASLARSRNVPLPAPPPVKKATLSSSAAERLSKPTAASMSKARAPPHAASPIRTVKSTSAGLTPRGPSKLRVGLAPARMNEAKTQEDAAKVATNNVEHQLNHLESGYSDNGHDLEETVISEGITDLHEVRDHVDEVPAIGVRGVLEEVVESIVEVLHPEATHAEIHVDAMVDDVQVSEPEVHPEALPVVEELLSHGDANSDDSIESQEFATEETVHSAGSEVPAVDDDIEDMVVMLESVVLLKHRPQSIVSIPDEHGEIPDEDQS